MPQSRGDVDALSETTKITQPLGAELIKNAWQHLCEDFVFCVSGDRERVGSERGLDTRVVEMQDGAVIADHVHFLDVRDRVHSQFLQRRLKFLVVGCCGLVNDLLLSAGCSLSTESDLVLELLEFFGIHFVCVCGLCLFVVNSLNISDYM